MRAWSKVTDAVHSKGGFLFAQLWNVGRFTVKENLGGRSAWSSTNKTLEGEATTFVPSSKPTPYQLPDTMTEEQIQVTLEDYAHASRCSVEAGFDGIEIVRSLRVLLVGLF